MLNAGEANDKTMENRSRIIEEHIVRAMMNGEFSAETPFLLDDAEIKALNSLGYDVELDKGFHWISREDKDVSND